MRYLTFAILIAINLVFSIQLAVAESYSFYVDKSAEDDGNGSKEKPFSDLKDAIEKAGGGDKIHVKAGKYEGRFTIPKKVGIYGEDRDKVVIEGPIKAEDGVVLENLSISGGNTALLAIKDATVTVSKSIVRDAARIGIDIPPGNGKVTVKNAKLYNNGKGIYIQQGNRFELTGSSVYKNREEGIDLRDDNDGFIQGNEIYENGESGIEIILGNTDMVISGNSIRDNEASGIATQYYEAFNGEGKLVFKNNKVEDNGKFGLRCDMPKAGNPPPGYFDRSLELDDNVFNGNKAGKFSEMCRISLSEKELEEINRQKEEKLSQLQKQQEELAKQKELEEKQKQLEESIRKINEERDMIEVDFNELESAISRKIEDLDNDKGFAYFFFGPKKERLEEIGRDMDSSREKIGLLRTLADQAPTDEIKGDIESKIISLELSIGNSESLLENWKSELSFWKRVKNIFSS